jgi:hypothetical protein
LNPAFAGMTGTFGGVNFIDGISDHIDRRTADRLGMNISVEEIEGDGPYFDRLAKAKAEMSAKVRADIDEKAPQSPPALIVDVTPDPSMPAPSKAPEHPVEAAPASQKYTREALEQIADDGGIIALREIGNPLGVRANSIRALIASILEAQGANV